jgi:hypothetical protein
MDSVMFWLALAVVFFMLAAIIGRPSGSGRVGTGGLRHRRILGDVESDANASLRRWAYEREIKRRQRANKRLRKKSNRKVW